MYVHVPFCRSRCDYCSFATWTDRGHLVEAYVDAVVADIARAVAAGMPSADTVFFGGGTPTLIAPELLVRMLDGVPRSPGAEVTVPQLHHARGHDLSSTTKAGSPASQVIHTSEG